MTRPFLILTFISTLVGCRVSFDVSKDRLGPFRIAAIGVESLGNTNEDCPVASAAIWSGVGMSHSQPVVAEWFLEGRRLEAVGTSLFVARAFSSWSDPPQWAVAQGAGGRAGP